MNDGVFAYTWDVVGDPAAAERIAALGVGAVTLQANYHSVRAMTPWHPQHRVIHAEHAAAYFRVRKDRWPGWLRPPEPTWGVADPDRFGTAATALTAAGLRVEAWLVLTHSTALGLAAPDLTVRNAFGESYPYALCPAWPEVRDYVLTLVSEVCAQYDVPALVLEACGWLGFDHGSHHDKTGGVELSAGARALLSVCLCVACRAALTSEGVDVAVLAHDIRAAVDAELRAGVPATLGDEHAVALYRHRTAVITGLVREARVLAGQREVLLMATDDPLVTGPDVGLDLAGFRGGADAYVLKCWADEDRVVDAVKNVAGRTGVPLVANVTVLDGRPEALATRVARLRAAGASAVRFYHAGLASAARLAALRMAANREER